MICLETNHFVQGKKRSVQGKNDLSKVKNILFMDKTFGLWTNNFVPRMKHFVHAEDKCTRNLKMETFEQATALQQNYIPS